MNFVKYKIPYHSYLTFMFTTLNVQLAVFLAFKCYSRTLLNLFQVSGEPRILVWGGGWPSECLGQDYGDL